MIGGLSPSLSDRGRAADARPKVGRRRRRRSPNISYDLILSLQFLLLPQSSPRSQTKSQLVAERAQTHTHEASRCGNPRRGRRSGVQVCGATKCYNWRAATPGHRASVMCRLPTATRGSGIFWVTSGIVTSGDSGGGGEDGSGEVGAAVRRLPGRGGRWQASWEGQVNRRTNTYSS